MKRIVLLEDSELYAEYLPLWLQAGCGVTAEQIERVRTEREFMESIPKWECTPPGLFLLDVMVPFEAGQGGLRSHPDSFYRAGIRCTEALLSSEKLRMCPIIIHDLMNIATINTDVKYKLPIAENVQYIEKGYHKVNKLLLAVHDVLHTPVHPQVRVSYGSDSTNIRLIVNGCNFS